MQTDTKVHDYLSPLCTMHSTQKEEYIYAINASLHQVENANCTQILYIS